jgi:hypothetical protein
MNEEKQHRIYRSRGPASVYFQGCPPKVHRRFKVHCTMRGISMQNAVIQFMRQYVTNKYKMNPKYPVVVDLENGKNLIFKSIPRDTYQLFKASCTRKGESVQNAMIAFMTNFSARPGEEIIDKDEDNGE